MTRKTLKKSGWLLSLVVAVFLAFGPAIAPVLSTSSKNATIEICTAFGLVKKAVSGDFSQEDKGKSHAQKNNHCVFCSLRKVASLPQPLCIPAPQLSFVSFITSKEDQSSHSSPAHNFHARAPPSLLT